MTGRLSIALLICSAALLTAQQEQEGEDGDLRKAFDASKTPVVKALRAASQTEDSESVALRLFERFRTQFVGVSPSGANEEWTEEALEQVFRGYMVAKQAASLLGADTTVDVTDFNLEYLTAGHSNYQAISFGEYRPAKIISADGDNEWVVTPRLGTTTVVAPVPERLEETADIWTMRVELRDRLLSWTAHQRSLNPHRVLNFAINPAVTDLPDYGVVAFAERQQATDVYLNNVYQPYKTSLYQPVGPVAVMICKDDHFAHYEEFDLSERQIHLVDVVLSRLGEQQGTEVRPNRLLRRLFDLVLSRPRQRCIREESLESGGR